MDNGKGKGRASSTSPPPPGPPFHYDPTLLPGVTHNWNTFEDEFDLPPLEPNDFDMELTESELAALKAKDESRFIDPRNFTLPQHDIFDFDLRDIAGEGEFPDPGDLMFLNNEEINFDVDYTADSSQAGPSTRPQVSPYSFETALRAYEEDDFDALDDWRAANPIATTNWQVPNPTAPASLQPSTSATNATGSQDGPPATPGPSQPKKPRRARSAATKARNNRITKQRWRQNPANRERERQAQRRKREEEKRARAAAQAAANASSSSKPPFPPPPPPPPPGGQWQSVSQPQLRPSGLDWIDEYDPWVDYIPVNRDAVQGRSRSHAHSTSGNYSFNPPSGMSSNHHHSSRSRSGSNHNPFAHNEVIDFDGFGSSHHHHSHTSSSRHNGSSSCDRSPHYPRSHDYRTSSEQRAYETARATERKRQWLEDPENRRRTNERAAERMRRKRAKERGQVYISREEQEESHREVERRAAAQSSSYRYGHWADGSRLPIIEERSPYDRRGGIAYDRSVLNDDSWLHGRR